MSQFDPRGGGRQQFSEMSKIKKSLKFPVGGGEVKPIWEFFPNFSFFLWWLPLAELYLSKYLKVKLAFLRGRNGRHLLQDGQD